MYENCCRTCLSEDTLNSIYMKHELEDETRTTAELIEIVSSIKMEEDDILPKFICEICKEEILRSYLFKKQIIQTDDFLKFKLGIKEQKEEDQEYFEHQDEMGDDYEIIEEYVDVNVKSELEDVNDEIEIYLSDLETEQTPQKERKPTKRLSCSVKCTYCPIKVSNKERLEKHIKKCHTTPNENPFKCYSCDRCFKSKEDLIKHESDKVLGLCKKVPGKANRKCFVCGEEFENIPNKIKHLESEHLDYEKKCQHCGYVCKSIRSFDRHLRFHEFGFDFFCAECGKSFKSRSALRDHNSMRHTKNYKEFTCDLCGFSFKMREHLLRHMKEIHLKLLRFKCEYCEDDVRFIRQVALDRHLINEHNFATSIVCDICQQGFVFRSQLNYHIKMKHRDSKTRVVMKKQVKKKPLTLVCEICKKVLRTKYGLVRHMMTHDNLKPFNCEFCDKKFTQKSILDVHKRTHTGEKPFECSGCKKTFGDPSTLSKHISSAHPSMLIYDCDICQKKFPAIKTLEIHKTKIHKV